jgi:hypothetical protein
VKTLKRPIDRLPDGWKPEFFITITSKRAQTRDELDVAVRKYCLWLARLTGEHHIAIAGIEWGHNSHAHLVICTRGFKNKEQVFSNAFQRRLWGFGRVDVQHFDHDRFADFYTAKHRVVSLGNEVFCPTKKRACRKNRCPYQVGMTY